MTKCNTFQPPAICGDASTRKARAERGASALMSYLNEADSERTAKIQNGHIQKQSGAKKPVQLMAAEDTKRGEN